MEGEATGSLILAMNLGVGEGPKRCWHWETVLPRPETYSSRPAVGPGRHQKKQGRQQINQRDGKSHAKRKCSLPTLNMQRLQELAQLPASSGILSIDGGEMCALGRELADVINSTYRSSRGSVDAGRCGFCSGAKCRAKR